MFLQTADIQYVMLRPLCVCPTVTLLATESNLSLCRPVHDEEAHGRKNSTWTLAKTRLSRMPCQKSAPRGPTFCFTLQTRMVCLPFYFGCLQGLWTSGMQSQSSNLAVLWGWWAAWNALNRNALQRSGQAVMPCLDMPWYKRNITALRLFFYSFVICLWYLEFLKSEEKQSVVY